MFTNASPSNAANIEQYSVKLGLRDMCSCGVEDSGNVLWLFVLGVAGVVNMVVGVTAFVVAIIVAYDATL